MTLGDLLRQEGRVEGLVEGLAEGMTEGMAEGRYEAKLKHASKMREHGISWEIVTDVTGLRPEDLEGAQP